MTGGDGEVESILLADQAKAAGLCSFTRAAYQKYSVRSQKISYAGAPVRRFEESLQKKLGPGGNWDAEMGKALSFHSHIYLSVAERHLHGLEILLSSDPVPITIGPAARSVAEASGRALWLLDFTLEIGGNGSRRRMARYYLDDEDNARNYKNVSEAFGHPGSPGAGMNWKRAKEKIRKPGVFYPSEIDIHPENGSVRLCGEMLPGPSKFVFLAGELFGDDTKETAGHYQYMSSMTHPTIFTFLETLASPGDDYEETGYVPPNDNGGFALTIACNAVRAFCNAWRVWVSWTNTGSDEVDAVSRMHEKFSG